MSLSLISIKKTIKVFNLNKTDGKIIDKWEKIIKKSWKYNHEVECINIY